MKRGKQELLSNLMYMLSVMYKVNKNVYLIKIPQIILNAASPFIPIVFIRLILNEIAFEGNVKNIVIYVMLMGLATFLFNIFGNIADSYAKFQSEITVLKLKDYFGNAVMRMKYSDAEQPKIRDFIELAQDSANFQQVLNLLSAIVTSAITVIGLFAIIVTVQPVIFIFVALVVIFRLIADRKNRILWDKWRPRYAPIMRKVNYLLRIMRSIEFGKEVRSNNLQDWIYNKSDRNADTYLNASTKHNKELQINQSFSAVLSILQECAVYFILAYKVVFEGMPIGDFSMYMTSINTFSNNVSTIVYSISEILKMSLFASDFRYCLSLSLTSENENNTDITADNASIEFKNVYFKYPNTDRYVLENINLVISAGQSLSIVGVNGSGKTTMVKLLCRLYEPTSGVILINDRNVNDMPFEEYIGYIGAVFQDFKLFSFTVADNVSFDEDKNSDEITKCIIKSGLDYKLEQLPKGLETNINKEFDSEGMEFSGGESQKLAITRALYKNAPVMILDEPTAALDPLAEYDIYSRFNDIVMNKTAIYISHRMSSCQFCDKIAVLDKGQIIQYGKHKELVKEEGLYSQMWNIQKKYYER